MPPENTPNVPSAENVMESSPKNLSLLLIIGGAAVVVLIIGAFVYMRKQASQLTQPVAPILQTAVSPAPVPPSTPKAVPTDTSGSLGGNLYMKAQDPTLNKSTVEQPAANPINDAYKNPFN